MLLKVIVLNKSIEPEHGGVLKAERTFDFGREVFGFVAVNTD